MRYKWDRYSGMNKFKEQKGGRKIMHREIPLRDIMTEAEFNEMMNTGLEQAKAGDSMALDIVFDSLLNGTDLPKEDGRDKS